MLTINADDKIITVSDKFEPMKDVSVRDEEDVELTEKIGILKNEV